ncbi:MAG TPA: hypothetical protein VMR90_01380 [Candidatus Cybelea sp.]|nr:hypothetical protein [Candidatus Cybelea sp.]
MTLLRKVLKETQRVKRAHPANFCISEKIFSPSREGKLLSDHVVQIAGRSVTITGHDIILTLVSIVIGLVFWTALYFSRKRIVVLKSSSGTNQVTFELSRIADALERIANRPADRAIAEASQHQPQMQPSSTEESRGITYSMFGR